MTTTHTHSATTHGTADAALRHCSPPRAGARRIFNIAKREGAEPWLTGIAFAVLTYAAFVFAGGFH